MQLEWRAGAASCSTAHQLPKFVPLGFRCQLDVLGLLLGSVDSPQHPIPAEGFADKLQHAGRPHDRVSSGLWVGSGISTKEWEPRIPVSREGGADGGFGPNATKALGLTG